MTMIWKVLYKLLAILVLGGSFLFGWYWLQYDKFVASPMLAPDMPSVIIELKPKMGVRTFSRELAKQGLIPNPRFFEILTRLHQAGRSLKAGEYEITPGLRPAEFLDRLLRGQVVQHQITFVEGWHLDQVLAALAKDVNIEHTLTPQNLDRLKVSLQILAPNLEGQFFPDTYEFPKGTTDQMILKTAHQKMQTLLDEQWRLRSSDLNYHTPYQALIVASLIEKESAVKSERPLIAGIINQRLKIKMRLQIDASVIYGLGSAYKGVLTRSDLKIQTPYNTYMHYGLPPTPIAIPGLTAIQAAVAPQATNFLYYVAKGDGTHTFSDTLHNHHIAVKESKAHVKHQAKAI